MKEYTEYLMGGEFWTVLSLPLYDYIHCTMEVQVLKYFRHSSRSLNLQLKTRACTEYAKHDGRGMCSQREMRTDMPVADCQRVMMAFTNATNQ
jgi:hypothetical protein